MVSRGLLLFLVFLKCIPLSAQGIKGDVLDMDDKQPVSDVHIANIHTSLDVTTNFQGAFIIAASNDQLLEFSKPGYKTVRVRIPNGHIPPFFRIIMKRSGKESQALAKNNRYDYKEDSLRYAQLYEHELKFPKMSTFDMLASPFTALSSRNRNVWKFQDTYDYFEKEKYVDRTFNAELITKVTGLQGDSLNIYMRRYRPTYDQLRTMNDYTFFSYIKNSVHYFRSPNYPRGAH